jgi:DNA-binding GntR family transcriptional regulator
MAITNKPIGLAHLPPMNSGDTERLTRKVVRHVSNIMKRGQVGPGGRLPGERTVASDLAVSRNTVTAAFNELEQRGLIRRIRGKGTFRCSQEGTGESSVVS